MFSLWSEWFVWFVHVTAPQWKAAQNSEQDEETCLSKNADWTLSYFDVVNKFLIDLFVKTRHVLKTYFWNMGCFHEQAH